MQAREAYGLPLYTSSHTAAPRADLGDRAAALVQKRLGEGPNPGRSLATARPAATDMRARA